MPRYALSRSDAEALIAHLKRLGEARARRGRCDAAHRHHPARCQAPAARGRHARCAAAYVETGEPRRRPASAQARLVVAGDYREAQERFAAEPVFALVESLRAGTRGELRALVEETRLPVVGPSPARPRRATATASCSTSCRGSRRRRRCWWISRRTAPANGVARRGGGLRLAGRRSCRAGGAAPLRGAQLRRSRCASAGMRRASTPRPWCAR